jgi:hypothetical protein
MRLGTSPRAVAVLGDSRALYGVDLGALREGLGSERPIQLAIQASTPKPILADLAADEAFRGLAIVAVSPVRFFGASDASALLPNRYLARTAERAGSPASAAEARLSGMVQGATVLRKVELSPLMLLRLRRWPEPRSLAADRSRRSHFPRNDRLRALEREQVALLREVPRLEGAAMEALLSELARAVRRIEARGGRVVFVRMPSGHLHRQLERERAPRERYWDALARVTEAPAIHFEDHAELRELECPDGSHLDAVAARAFTRALAVLIRWELARVRDGRFG